MRTVPLPADVPGRLFLHSMPGRLEEFAAARDEITGNDISEVVCLTPQTEVNERSPEYAKAIDAGLPWKHVPFPMEDRGVPTDADAFLKLAKSVAQSLREGNNVLLHCMAGIGRTGTFAVAVLCELGVSLPEAHRTVKAAGSSAESDVQRRFLEKLYLSD